MLSRHAEHFYWIGRYIERVNNTVSLLEVTHLTLLEGGVYGPQKSLWESLIHVNQGLDFFEKFYSSIDEKTVHAFLLFSLDNPSSVVTSIRSVRENLRVVRSSISTAMWLIVNDFYLSLQKSDADQILSLDRTQFFRKVKDFCLTFYGACGHTLLHDEGFNFLKLGRALERALETTNLLEFNDHALHKKFESDGNPLDLHQWEILLRSVDGFQPYLHIHKNRILPVKVVEFLMLNREAPRSIHYNLSEIRNLLPLLNHRDTLSFLNLEKKTNGLLAELEATSVERIFTEGFTGYLQGILEQLAGLDVYFRQNYFGLSEAPDEERPQ